MKIRKICKKDFSEIGAPNKTSSYTWAIPSLLYPILSWKTLAFWPGLAIRRLANGSHRHLGLYPDVSTRAAQIHWFWSSDALSTGRLQTFGVLKGAKCCLLHHIVVVVFLGGASWSPTRFVSSGLQRPSGSLAAANSWNLSEGITSSVASGPDLTAHYSHNCFHSPGHIWWSYLVVVCQIFCSDQSQWKPEPLGIEDELETQRAIRNSKKWHFGMCTKMY